MEKSSPTIKNKKMNYYQTQLLSRQNNFNQNDIKINMITMENIKS